MKVSNIDIFVLKTVISFKEYFTGKLTAYKAKPKKRQGVGLPPLWI